MAGLSEFIPRFNLSGSTSIVVGEIVGTLWNFGSLDDGDTALGKLLVTVKEYTGKENKEFLDHLIQKYQLIPITNQTTNTQVMTNNSQFDSNKRIIKNHKRRLQILKERHALLGLNTQPKILIEIEDIEKQIAELS